MSELTELGRKTMDAVYGSGFSESLPQDLNPMLADTVDHLSVRSGAVLGCPSGIGGCW